MLYHEGSVSICVFVRLDLALGVFGLLERVRCVGTQSRKEVKRLFELVRGDVEKISARRLNAMGTRTTVVRPTRVTSSKISPSSRRNSTMRRRFSSTTSSTTNRDSMGNDEEDQNEQEVQVLAMEIDMRQLRNSISAVLDKSTCASRLGGT